MTRPRRPDRTGGDEAIDPAAGTEIQDALAGPQAGVTDRVPHAEGHADGLLGEVSKFLGTVEALGNAPVGGAHPGVGAADRLADRVLLEEVGPGDVADVRLGVCGHVVFGGCSAVSMSSVIRALGGNAGPNAVELVLQALGFCYGVGYVVHAAARGIELSELRYEVEGDIDLQNFLGMTKETRPGFSAIRARAWVRSPNATPEQLEELCQYVQDTSPVRDVLANPTPVETDLEVLS